MSTLLYNKFYRGRVANSGISAAYNNHTARRRRSPSPPAPSSLAPIDEEVPLVEFDTGSFCGMAVLGGRWDNDASDDGCYDYRKTDTDHIETMVAATVAVALFLLVLAAVLGVYLGRLELDLDLDLDLGESNNHNNNNNNGTFSIRGVVEKVFLPENEATLR